MTRLLAGVALFFALACAGLPTPLADDAAPEAGTAYMVIVAGSPDRKEGEKLLAAYTADGLPAVGGHPRLVESATVEGLKPGFWIVVAATLADEGSAKAMAAAYQGPRKGTYVREVEVTGAEDATCPTDPRCAVGPWKAIVIFDVTSGVESEDWGFFTDDIAREGPALGYTVVWAEGTRAPIEVGGKRVGTVDIGPFRGELFGYVFAMAGKAPQYQAHAPTSIVLEEANRYFGP